MGSTILSKRNAQPHAMRSDSDPPAPVEGRQASFDKAEREVAMNTIRGTDMRNLEKFPHSKTHSTSIP